MDTQPLRIGIAGLNGRVGRLLAEEVPAGGALLVGGTTRDGASVTGIDCPVYADISDLAPQCDVVIDFTHVATVETHAIALTLAGTAWVLGTTGLSTRAQQAVDTTARRIAVVQAANFSPGVTLVTRLARQMGAALPGSDYDAEILEMHHRQKVDAPSGTALAMGRAVAEGRGIRLEEHIESGRDGHTGPRTDGAIGFAALRGGQIVGEHSVIFTSSHEQISLTHRSFDRRVYATGAVRAAQWLRTRPPGLYDMEDVLGLKQPTR
ncbi:4-hydroxy-tetrahydrodipicolinate reductase [Komagataeibacter rhaeticus]|uniref:4-hydroxy-tetrahydrodipicolinate reductase n=1 Tax=Komagataeibacter rhaeticus TaxID=215221 RepID=UPI0004D4462C|nr:4-hydroxy-tetrahydrodipicolinate reductase [Komagataeibacter rhaeticus]KDU97542.1 dihydrodipicolinate reductase [Komagataeibacter rhaeticus AF1]MBL7240814.1 4-hydroxy-tetrahydrodipicolinate reductase [Komagataeibacter rhaeticus]PYD54926.1 4-hydroxy-tetrahydrodipicolinate reductase [Komagataeibacter rhaeticus]GBQ14110.1 dihydrodipicolinate reductase [Komagataeibacter rhaeticus DSM 16663]